MIFYKKKLQLDCDVFKKIIKILQCYAWISNSIFLIFNVLWF